MHSLIKERTTGSYPYFHVRINTKVNGRKIESQRYFFYTPDNRTEQLRAATKAANHLHKRHNQLRQARDNRTSICELFFNKNGTPKYLGYRKRVRTGRSEYYEFSCQKYTDGVQIKKSKTLPLNDPEALVFDSTFNTFFEWLCAQIKIPSNNNHVLLFKGIIRNHFWAIHHRNISESSFLPPY